MFKPLFCLGLAAASFSAFAAEPPINDGACERVTQVLKQTMRVNAPTFQPATYCTTMPNSQPPEYWACMEERLKQGDAFYAAAQNCRSR